MIKSKLKLYNTLTRKKEEFKPIKAGKVGVYVCGPTVYDYVHIGNLRAYLFSDLLRRYFKYFGFKIKEVMNLTDVDDKTIKRSQQEGVSLKELTLGYKEAFLEDLKKLNIETPEIMPKATEHIKDMVNLIKILLKKGYAYKASDGIYFSIKKFKQYGKFARINLKKLKQTKRIKQKTKQRIISDSYDKEDISDFALWKFYTKKDGNVFYNTEIGKGRPGWHIECSAMSMKYLGKNFDIHTGGIDLIFPHHQNEIAQSEAATHEKFVNCWLHNEWLFVDGKKMSKSLGNFYILRDIVKRGFLPLAFRYLCLATHYRTQLNFTWQNLKNAENSYKRLKNIIGEIIDDKKENKKYLQEFEKAMNNDLDTSSALQVLWKLVRDKKAKGKIKTIEKMDEIFALDLLKQEKVEVPTGIMKLVKEREKARKNKNYKLADSIREKIRKKGWWVDDRPKGVKMRKL